MGGHRHNDAAGADRRCKALAFCPVGSPGFAIDQLRNHLRWTGNARHAANVVLIAEIDSSRIGFFNVFNLAKGI
ncbi:hypothetical protein ABIE13_001318 [Ottowia thiooxydans]|uniref:Uncharacterized protein n=1 Tax=Ottowia thiooxydans TaxID=219182 RepID=A0ABV2Q5B2_9BURK